MKVKPIFVGNFTIAVNIDSRDEDGAESDVEKFLKSQMSTKQFGANVRGLLGLMKEFSENGSRNLTEPQFHIADGDSGLWRFSKGRLRIYCMKDDEDNLILLTGALIKKTQPTEKQVIRQAKSIWKEYQKAKQEGRLEIVSVKS